MKVFVIGGKASSGKTTFGEYLREELKEIKEKYQDVVAIKLERSNYESNLSEEEKNHITEKDLDNYQGFDYIVENSNLKDLKRVALEIVRNEENYGG